ncbi:hypothetical protein SprV_0200534900 [Sparganum proliferum]
MLSPIPHAWAVNSFRFADRTEVIVRGKTEYIPKNIISRRLKFDTAREELFACVRGSRFQLSFLEVLICEHTSRYATKLLLAAACTCGILTSIAGLLICFRKRGQLKRLVLKKMRRRASGGASSGDAATAATTTIREEDGTAGDRTRLNQVFPTGLRLPLLRPLHQLSLHERINRLTDLGFFPARRVQIGNLLYSGCHSRVYSGSISTILFVNDAFAPDNRVILKTLPTSEQTRSRTASPLSLNIPHALPTRAYGEGVEVSVHVHGESVYACKQARLTQF